MYVDLPSHFRYERRIDNVFEIQNVSWSYFGYIFQIYNPNINSLTIRQIWNALKEWRNL
jgi:hypothetical protein